MHASMVAGCCRRPRAAQGIIVHGCIRDSEDIGRMPWGVKALATHPLKSSKRDAGLRDVPLTFAGVTVRFHLFLSGRLAQPVTCVPVMMVIQLLQGPVVVAPWLHHAVPAARAGVCSQGRGLHAAWHACMQVKPGDWCYADMDGVLVSPEELKL